MPNLPDHSKRRGGRRSKRNGRKQGGDDRIEERGKE
jgi:hypothetical protein